MNKITKIIIAIIVIALVIWAIIAIVGKTNEQEANKATGTIKIGVIAPLSGDVSFLGEQLQRVLDYNLAKINQKVVDQGVKFELIYEDGKCNGTDAVSAFQKLTDIDNVQFILGGVCSSETLAIAPLITEKKVLDFTFSSHPDIDGISPYIYSFGYKDDANGQTMAKEMSKYSKVAIITEQNDYNIGIQKVWLEAIKQYPNVTVVADETFTKGGADFRTILEKIKREQPEAILLNPNGGPTATNLIKQLAEIKDWNNYQLFGNISYLDKNVLAVAPEAVEDMVIIDAAQINDPNFMAIYQDIETTKGELSAIGTYYTAAGLDASTILTDLLLKYGADVEAINEVVRTKEFSGYISDKFDFKTSSFPDVPGGIYIVKNGVAKLQ